jgi:CelD/BcsL family acetyltransferase involved in cellulose biosynthesis
MPVYEIDPLTDTRWDEFLSKDPRASVFHSSEWLRVLQQTYDYRPLVFTTTPPREPLTNGLALCRIDSWLTGRRMVSLPFSDHCDLLAGESELAEITGFLREEAQRQELKYIELRPVTPAPEMLASLDACSRYHFHHIDLAPSEAELYDRLHKNSIQRKLRRASREGLEYHKGTGPELIDAFYKLFVMTRRRHGLPPSSRLWIDNLMGTFNQQPSLDGPRADIRLATWHDQPVAGMLTLNYRGTTTYKYGGMDKDYARLGGMSLLFWKAMIEAKAAGMRLLDLGRCELDNPGLITYKERLGAQRSSISYLRIGGSAPLNQGLGLRFAKWVLPYAPDPVRIRLGGILYPHVG